MTEEWMNEYEGPIYSGGSEIKVIPFEFPDDNESYIIDDEPYVTEDIEDGKNYIIGGSSMTMRDWLLESFKDLKIQ